MFFIISWKILGKKCLLYSFVTKIKSFVCPNSQVNRNYEKQQLILGTSNAWSVTPLSKRTREAAYYIIDWRILEVKNIEICAFVRKYVGYQTRYIPYTISFAKYCVTFYVLFFFFLSAWRDLDKNDGRKSRSKKKQEKVRHMIFLSVAYAANWGTGKPSPCRFIYILFRSTFENGPSKVWTSQDLAWPDLRINKSNE